MDTVYGQAQEYGLNERLLLKRVYEVEKGHAKIEHWRDLTLWLRSRKLELHGWVENLRWTVSSPDRYIRISDDNDSVLVTLTEEFKGSHSAEHVRVYATSDDFLIIAIMFLDRIKEGVDVQAPAVEQVPAWIKDIETAKQVITASKFPDWHSGLGEEAKADPLMVLLIQRYKQDHDDVVEKASLAILNSILKTCAAHGVRFASISHDDLVCFEDVRTARLPIGQPMAWHIGSLLGFDDWGNGPHARAHLWHFLLDEHAGCYDLRGGSGQWAKVAPALNFSDACWRLHQKDIEATYDNIMPLEMWFSRCGEFRSSRYG